MKDFFKHAAAVATPVSKVKIVGVLASVAFIGGALVAMQHMSRPAEKK